MLNDLIIRLNEKFGTPQVFYVASLSFWPMSIFMFPKIKSRNLTLILHLTIGLGLCYLLFQKRLLFCLIPAIVLYPFLSLNPFVVTVLAFLGNSITNLYQMFSGPASWSMDVTALALTMFQKIVSISFNIDDGRKVAKGESFKVQHFKNVALEAKPSFLAWLAYCFTPFGCSSGPFYEYKLFDEIVSCAERKHIAPDSTDRELARKRYFGSMVYALITSIGFSICSRNTYESDFYLESMLIFRLVMMLFLTSIQAVKYYTVWWTTEAALFEFGLLGSECVSTTNEISISNLSFTDVLKSESSGIWLQRWNHSAHLFWKNYLFYRLLHGGYGYNIAYYAVFVASALWHGFKPVYYMVLPELLLCAQTDKELRKKFDVTPSNIYMFRLWVICSNLFSTCSWWHSTAKSFIYIRNTVYWVPQIGMVCVFLFARFSHKRKKEKAEK